MALARTDWRKKLRNDNKEFLSVGFELPEEWIVYRVKKRHTHHLYFVHPDHKEMVESRVRKAMRTGFGAATQMMYMATYVVDLNAHTMVKNRYPDQPLPAQIFEEIFSGVSDAIEI